MAALLDFRFLKFCLILRGLETAKKHHFICQNYDISRNILEYLIVFIQKIESLTTNFIFY